jgi:diaminopimelate decarboxylase
MNSTDNSRPLVLEVLVAGDLSTVIRARLSYDALLALDAIPDWLREPPAAPMRIGGVG